jgi:predicted dehydrogenase
MIGVAGAGRWGKEIVRVLWELDQEVEIYDPAFTKGSYADLVSRADRIVIAAPPQHHFDLAWKALAARRPVYVEKPLTLDFGQAKRLAKYAKGTQVGVGHILLHADGFQPFLGLSPQKIRTYRSGMNPGYHNISAWWDLGVHDVSACVALYGRPQKVRVEQDFDTYRAELKWDNCYAVLVGNRRSVEKRWDIEFDGVAYSPYSETVEPLMNQMVWWLAGGDNLAEAVTVVETLARS